MLIHLSNPTAFGRTQKLGKQYQLIAWKLVSVHVSVTLARERPLARPTIRPQSALQNRRQVSKILTLKCDIVFHSVYT